MADTSWTGRFTGASAVSFVVHAAGLALLLLFLGSPDAQLLISNTAPPEKLVFLPHAGFTGGGGGSPGPAAPRPMQIAAHVETVPPPIAPPEHVTATEPAPTLNAPVETSAATLMQATGVSQVALAGPGANGARGGVGPGDGPGVGPGRQGGFGNGVPGTGNGVSDPIPIRRERPNYTPEALQKRLQGDVMIEAIVLANGTVGDVQVVRSLDRVSGLDAEAMKAARLWLFRPARDPSGNAVAVKITIILEFRLH